MDLQEVRRGGLLWICLAVTLVTNQSFVYQLMHNGVALKEY